MTTPSSRTHKKAQPKNGAGGASDTPPIPEMPLALSYDDVLLVPQRTTVSSRREVSTATFLSRHVRLQIPIVAANMDTVTESGMAIEMARQGGIGIIHRFLPIEAQAEQVRLVKRAESFVVAQPYTVSPEATVAQARSELDRQDVSSLVAVDEQERFAGLLMARDLEQASPEAAAASATDKQGHLLVGAAIGVVGDAMERAEALLNAGADVLVVDVAHGHADSVLEVVQALKARWPGAEVIAGNVATAEGARDLIEAGVDAVKVGVGPGSACTTRIVTGAGVPQFTAVMECAVVCHKAGVPLIADGGIKTSGDIAKAIAAGASTVMLGSLLAGTDESPGQTVTRRGQLFKTFRGMASLSATTARKRRERELSDIRQQEDDSWVSQVVPEGVEAMVPYRGPVRETLVQLVGGLRSGMSYSNAHTVEELWQNARFVRITSAGLRESGPHDLVLD